MLLLCYICYKKGRYIRLANAIYICDGKACSECSSPVCEHTPKVEHAVNFKKGYGGYYYEKRQNLVAETDKSTLTANDFQRDALATRNPSLDRQEQLLDGLMGLNGEAGEAIDILKKHRFQGHALKTDNLILELGDVAWYIAIAADALGYDLETVLKKNMAKRKERYPNGFDPDKSIHRKEGV